MKGTEREQESIWDTEYPPMPELTEEQDELIESTARRTYLEQALQDAREDVAKYRRERDVMKDILVSACRSNPDPDRIKEIFRMLEAVS